MLQSLPTDVQKNIEETRAACQEASKNFPPGHTAVPSLDSALETFTVGGKQAVLIDPVNICGSCHTGGSCDNHGTRPVTIYVLTGKAWRMALSNNVMGDIFVSYVPGSDGPGGYGGELNALVVDVPHGVGVKGCPRGTPRMSRTTRRSCIVRWNGTKFTYKPL